MKRSWLPALLTVLTALLLAPSVTLAGHSRHHRPKPSNFRASLAGSTVYFNLAGQEPDFDPLYRVVIITHAHARGLPTLNLLLDAYIESFQPDTQPVLPDLINGKTQLSSQLGGFFSGKAMIVGPSNQILFTGDMLAEALIKPVCMYATGKVAPPECLKETQHMVVNMAGQGPAKGGFFRLKSIFVGNKSLRITSGSLWGRVRIPPRALKRLRLGGGSMAHCQEPPLHPKTPAEKKQAKIDQICINQILKDFQVARPAMQGTAGNGKPSHGYCIRGLCTNKGGTSGGGSPGSNNSTGGGAHQSTRPGWMAPLGIALIVLAAILLAFYLWQTRKERELARLQRGLPSTSGGEGGPSP